MKNGRPATQVACPVCGTKIFKIGAAWASRASNRCPHGQEVPHEGQGPDDIRTGHRVAGRHVRRGRHAHARGGLRLHPRHQDGVLVGIVTARDIVVRAVAAGKDPRTTPVSAVMSADPVTIAPDTDANEAARMMAEFQVRRLPVVDQGDQ